MSAKNHQFSFFLHKMFDNLVLDVILHNILISPLSLLKSSMTTAFTLDEHLAKWFDFCFLGLLLLSWADRWGWMEWLAKSYQIFPSFRKILDFLKRKFTAVQDYRTTENKVDGEFPAKIELYFSMIYAVVWWCSLPLSNWQLFCNWKSFYLLFARVCVWQILR